MRDFLRDFSSIKSKCRFFEIFYENHIKIGYTSNCRSYNSSGCSKLKIIQLIILVKNDFTNIFLVKKICEILIYNFGFNKNIINQIRFVKDRPGHDI